MKHEDLQRLLHLQQHIGSCQLDQFRLMTVDDDTFFSTYSNSQSRTIILSLANVTSVTDGHTDRSIDVYL